MIKSKGAKIGDWVIVSVCILLILICILPVFNILSRSLSHPIPLAEGKVLLLPQVIRSSFIYEPYARNAATGRLTFVSSDTMKESDAFEPVTETVVINRKIDARNNRTISEFLVERNGEFVPLRTQYDSGDQYWRIEPNDKTGTRIDSLTALEQGKSKTYETEYDDETGLGTLILEGAHVRRVSERPEIVTGLDFSHYGNIFKDSRYTWSLQWTAMLTVACAIWSVFMTAICAYPLTYDHLKGRKFFNTVIILTMYFGAGTVPTYVLLNNLGLVNHPLVLALPFCLSVFNMIIMRSYFYGIPISLRESAELDGAGPVRTLVSIYIPLSMPVIATLLLFYAVGRWNGYSDAMMFMNNNERFFPIQYLLYIMLNTAENPEVIMQGGGGLGAAEPLKMAMVMFAMIPILIVYPLLQRHFIAGVTLGAVKE